MKHRVAVVPGDGIGKEVVPGAIRVLERAGEIWGFGFDWTFFDWWCEYFLKTGRMMTEDGLERLREHDAIFLGAVGYPEVPDHVSLWGLLIPIRRNFRQYINLRPVRLFGGIESPLRGVAPEDIDYTSPSAGCWPESESTISGISSRLHLSGSIVRNYLSSAIRKTGLRNRIEAARTARQNSWV